MTDKGKKRAYIMDRYHEHRPDPETEKTVVIGERLSGEIFEGIALSAWARKRLDQAVQDVAWLKYLETRYINVPPELKEMLHGL